ncbi:Sua5/YciO/YrdC/YwlC family protein [Helicobacter mesocricetorum]|uniref:Sua5/YciO/YrdC/YwlC family protein n=1 Tax=Helicobacter mesocricetorum TaxID=87012 RepID=UPI000CF1C2C4|nr:Sua5/YciO/YrdC/YwlC family protein [Helicobacter mesocricetorum]
MEICHPIFLAQSDTTAGFLCKDCKKLNVLKGRSLTQNILLTIDSFKKLQSFVRIPKKHKKEVRRLKQTTFIVRSKSCSKNLAIRVTTGMHNEFLSFFDGLYSTSANRHKQRFSLEFALAYANFVVLDKRGLKEEKSSTIYKVGNYNKKRIR